MNECEGAVAGVELDPGRAITSESGSTDPPQSASTWLPSPSPASRSSSVQRSPTRYPPARLAQISSAELDTMMQAYQDQLLPPSGVSHALSVRLSPPLDAPLPDATIISHLVTARTNQLQLWQVRERVGEDGEVSAAGLGWLPGTIEWANQSSDSDRLLPHYITFSLAHSTAQ